MNKRQPNFSSDELEVIVAGVEENSKVSAVQSVPATGAV